MAIWRSSFDSESSLDSLVISSGRRPGRHRPHGNPKFGFVWKWLAPSFEWLIISSQFFIHKTKDIPHVWPSPYYPRHLCSCWLWSAQSRSSSLDLPLNLEDPSLHYWTYGGVLKYGYLKPVFLLTTPLLDDFAAPPWLNKPPYSLSLSL